jgi:hypothetical protein
MAHPVPTAKSALKTILAARPAWAAVDIRDGQPTEQEDVTQDAFWFESTPVDIDQWASIGAQRRRITFHLSFTIAVIRQGTDDERSVEDVMWTLLDDLMAAVKANYTLGGVVQQVEDLTGTQSNIPIPGMWRAVFTGSIGCISKAY